jgi:hypothetical protein
MNLRHDGLAKWHTFVRERDAQALADALAENVVFHSPVLWKPKLGKAEAMLYISGAASVLEDFTYLRQYHNEQGVVLEFQAHIDQIVVKGVDMIQLNSAGQISDFEVMVRPAKAIEALATAMARQLALMASPEDER